MILRNDKLAETISRPDGDEFAESIDASRAEMRSRDDNLQESIDATRAELRPSSDSVKAEPRLRDEHMQDSE
jgi:hypothetical protein